MLDEPQTSLTADGFVATIKINFATGKAQLWHIRQDAKVWSE
jgi:hypothetical protein